MRTPYLRALRWWAPCLAVGLLFVHAAPPTAGAPEAPQVTVRTLGAPPFEGRLVSLGADTLGLAKTPGGPTKTLALENVIDVRFPPPASAPPKQALMRVHLTGGDVLAGRLTGPSEEGIRLAVDGLGTLDLSFDVIRTLESVPADAGPCHRPADLHPPAASGDIAYDVRDDEYRGTVLEATDEHLVMESSRGRRRTVPWAQLEVLHLENDALAPPEGLQAELELVGGSRLALAGTPALSGAKFRVASRSLPNTPLDVEATGVRTLRWSGGRFVYASALPFTSTRKPYHDDPEGLLDPAYLERWFGTRVDRRASGCPLRLGGITYRHGFGVNSHSRIEIALGGGYRRFRAVFGIDDEVLDQARIDGRRGDVDARVLADGKLLWEAKGVQGGLKPRPVGPLDVSGAQTLVLEVGFGKDLMTLDRADWVDPILERK